MRLRDKLRSPTGLVVQGFAAGAFLFFTVHPLKPGETPTTPPTGGVAIVAVTGA